MTDGLGSYDNLTLSAPLGAACYIVYAHLDNLSLAAAAGTKLLEPVGLTLGSVASVP
jgi:hypothetical protein